MYIPWRNMIPVCDKAIAVQIISKQPMPEGILWNMQCKISKN